MNETKEKMLKFAGNRPPVKGITGYGSRVKKQVGYGDNTKSQLDRLNIVKSILEYIDNNIDMSTIDIAPEAYDYIFKHIDHIRNTVGALFASNIEEDGETHKYGVIELDILIKNFYTWESLYIPGRFQKPNEKVIEVDSEELKKAEEYNNEKALIVGAILLRKKWCTKEELFCSIASISYIGDTRTIVENSDKKIKAMVKGSYDSWCEKYDKIIDKYPHIFPKKDGDHLLINQTNLLKEVKSLPPALYEGIVGRHIEHKNNPNNSVNPYDYIPKETYIKSIIDEVNNFTSKDIDLLASYIEDYLTGLNFVESIDATIINFIMNGPRKSTKYFLAKLWKKIMHLPLNISNKLYYFLYYTDYLEILSNYVNHNNNPELDINHINVYGKGRKK